MSKEFTSVENEEYISTAFMKLLEPNPAKNTFDDKTYSNMNIKTENTYTAMPSQSVVANAFYVLLMGN